MSIPILDRDSLIGIAASLNTQEDLLKFLDIHEEILRPSLQKRDTFWREIIQRKYNLLVKDAAQEDYDIFHAFETKSNSVNRTLKYKLMEIAGSCFGWNNTPLMGVREIVEKALLGEEEGSDSDYKLWLVNNKDWNWGEAKSFYTRAKTAAGAAYTLMEHSQEFKDKLFTYYDECYLEDTKDSRNIHRITQTLLDLYERTSEIPENHPFLPAKKDIEELHANSKEGSQLASPGSIVKEFLGYLRGDPADHMDPIFITYEKLELVEAKV